MIGTQQPNRISAPQAQIRDTAPMGEIMSAASTLHESIALLAQNVVELTQALDPVLSPVPPQEANVKGDAVPIAVSPLGEAIFSAVRQVNALRDEVRELAGRVRL